MNIPGVRVNFTAEVDHVGVDAAIGKTPLLSWEIRVAEILSASSSAAFPGGGRIAAVPPSTPPRFLRADPGGVLVHQIL